MPHEYGNEPKAHGPAFDNVSILSNASVNVSGKPAFALSVCMCVYVCVYACVQYDINLNQTGLRYQISLQFYLT